MRIARMSLPSVRQASAQEDERWGVPERAECQKEIRNPLDLVPGRGESNEPIHIF